MKYKGSISDVVRQKSVPRLLVRNMIYFVILGFIPVLTLLQQIGAVNVFNNAPFWRVWLFFVLGWIPIVFVSSIIAMRTFVSFLGLSEWDSLLFDKFYGFDVEVWSAFLCYIGVFWAFSIQYGISFVFSDIGIFGIMIILAIVASCILTLLAAKVVFKLVLYKN